MTQYRQPLRVRGHERVLDPVVHHLHEVARARRAAVQVSHLLGRGVAGATRRSSGRAHSRCERPEDGVEVANRAIRSADHHAEPALQPEDATAGAAIDEVDSPRRERARMRDVVDVVRVASVDDRVSRLQVRSHVVDDGTGHAGGHHQPHRARGRQLRDEICDRCRTDGTRSDEGLDRGGVVVVHDAFVSLGHAPAHEIRAHAAQADHSELHVNSCRS